MTIPNSSNYPDALDTNDNLFLVHDSLRVRLLKDYNPGDTTIYVEGDPVIMRRFPPTGMITLTEQCSDIDHRALGFYYGTVDPVNFLFSNLALDPDYELLDSVKPKRITNVTQNVMARHHNNSKDAVESIEQFVGVKGTTDTAPLGATMEGRVNYLRNLVLSPKAYFSVDRTIGLAPLTVTFTDLSFRLADDNSDDESTIEYLWDFGDHTVAAGTVLPTVDATITGTNTANAPSNFNELVNDPGGRVITKTYSIPGIFDVTLTVRNAFGSDSITIPALINARVDAPNPAIVEYFPTSSQTISPNTGVFNAISGDYIPPVIRSTINSLITMKIPSGLNPNDPGHTYAGEAVTSGGSIIDPVESYTWVLSDDLNHSKVNSSTKASYSIGGLFDMKLRVDTEFGAYRITTYTNSIDIVETQNLWMFNYAPNGGSVVGYEYGLISETFKTMPSSSFSPAIDPTFLTGAANSAQMIQEFSRNNGFVPTSNVASGNQGAAMLFYASGRGANAPISSESINFVAYNGFSQTYDMTLQSITRPWNWANFNSSTIAYFLLGSPTTAPAANASPVNATLTGYTLASNTYTTTPLTATQFSNGADELLSNIATFDVSGNNVYGNFSTYRCAWKSNTGYILRNDNVGTNFRIRSFYSTNGTLGAPVQTIAKLADMPGPNKTEGELLALTPGLFFFNNSGSISAYNDQAGMWETGGPGVNSIAFRSLQDQTVSNFDDLGQTLVAASDGDKRAYLSYDYSTSAFIKFDANSNVFASLSSRPPGVQWVMGIY